jgi:hypothetical protein
MILEVVTINPEHMDDDPIDKLNRTIERLTKKIENMRPIVHYYYPST